MPEKKQRGSALTWRDLKSSTRHSKQKNVPMSWRARLRALWTWTKRAFFLGLLIFAIWGGIYLYRNACFEDIFGAKSLKISRIEFITDGNLTGEWINKYLKIPADSTLSDVNIFAIKGAIDALGQVKSASVERVFPDVLRIKTSEYKPIAKAKIEIKYKHQKLFEDELPVSQFGTTEYLAPVLFNKNSVTQVLFDTTTGGLLKVDRGE